MELERDKKISKQRGTTAPLCLIGTCLEDFWGDFIKMIKVQGMGVSLLVHLKVHPCLKSASIGACSCGCRQDNSVIVLPVGVLTKIEPDIPLGTGGVRIARRLASYTYASSFLLNSEFTRQNLDITIPTNGSGLRTLTTFARVLPSASASDLQRSCWSFCYSCTACSEQDGE